MGDVTVHIEGPDAAEHGAALRADLGYPEVENDGPELESLGVDPATLIAVGGAAVKAAATIWRWWQGRQELPNVQVEISLPDGTQVRLNDVSEEQLAIILNRHLGSE